MDVVIAPLDEPGLADLLAAAEQGAEPAEVMPAAPGATWDDRTRAGFLAFHRGRALAADPVERTWVVREGGRAVGALRLAPAPDGAEVGLWLARGARGRGVGTAAVRRLTTTVTGPPVPLVARTTVSNAAALGLSRALGADTAPGTEGAVTARLPAVDHGGGWDRAATAVDEERREMASGIERPAVTGFHHVSAVVSDVESSATWYQRVLGMQRLPMTFPHHAVGGDPEKAALLLDSATGVMIELHAPSDGDGGPVRGALDHLAFGVADREALDHWAAWLDTLSIPHGCVVDRTDPTGYATLEFRDPDGVALEFIHFPGRG